MISDSMGRKEPFVIAIASGKGGVGKTTTALAIGTILARRGLKVLLIDLDPQGNLTLALGYKPHRLPPPTRGMPTAGTIFARESFVTKHQNLHLVFARSLIVNKNYEMQVNTGDDQFFLGQDLGVIKNLPYDYVVIDCPPSIGTIMANTLYSSDFLIIPSLAEFFSTSAVMDMMGLLDVVYKAGKTALPYRVLVTLYERKNQMHRKLKDELKITYSSNIFKTIIETDIALRQVAILGFPTRTSPGVKQYRELVDELVDIILGSQPVG